MEFPEARIYEETLNCLLYENRTGPDQDLMQATSHRPPGDGYTSNDEDERNRGAGEGGAAAGGGAVGGASGGSVSQRHSSGLSATESECLHTVVFLGLRKLRNSIKPFLPRGKLDPENVSQQKWS